MATKREILTHMLRVARDADESHFGQANTVIDGLKTRSCYKFIILLWLDPWMRNNTDVRECYKKSSDEWSPTVGKLFRVDDGTSMNEIYRSTSKLTVIATLEKAMARGDDDAN